MARADALVYGAAGGTLLSAFGAASAVEDPLGGQMHSWSAGGDPFGAWLWLAGQSQLSGLGLSTSALELSGADLPALHSSVGGDQFGCVFSVRLS